MTKKKVWSPDLKQLDRIRLTATWLKGTDTPIFAVRRFHQGTPRSNWEFEYIGNNQWECYRGGPWNLREQRVTADFKTRTSDTSRIPDDIQLKAREFLARTLKIKPKPKRTARSSN
jgi:hypothetical protein